jgi:predicted house-cleaning NTP pyrophosphatase (Maf/HAM1 superfamily)
LPPASPCACTSRAPTRTHPTPTSRSLGSDKAGGYGIQAQAGTFVDQLSGCYYNVVGFPIHTVARLLADLCTAPA